MSSPQNMLARGAALLAAQRDSAAGEGGEGGERGAGEVVYRRGQLSVSVPATRGRSEFQSVGSDGAMLSAESVDWLVTASRLVVGGRRIEPAPGDEVIDADGVVHEVAVPGNDRVWRWSDHSLVSIRIHSKRTTRRV